MGKAGAAAQLLLIETEITGWHPSFCRGANVLVQNSDTLLLKHLLGIGPFPARFSSVIDGGNGWQTLQGV